MESDIIDNQHIRLADRMRELLSGAVRAKFAVGYLFLDGLAPLCDTLKSLDSIELLIGNVTNRLTDEQVREQSETIRRSGTGPVPDQGNFAATLRGSHDRAAVETALNIRATIEALPHSLAIQSVVLTLAQRIADGGLKIRLYSGGRIHAKLGLIEYGHAGDDSIDLKKPHAIAVVGSSNLTLEGTSHPTELNVVVRDPDSIKGLTQWYQTLWDTSQDVHRELFDEFVQSWAVAGSRDPSTT